MLWFPTKRLHPVAGSAEQFGIAAYLDDQKFVAKQLQSQGDGRGVKFAQENQWVEAGLPAATRKKEDGLYSSVNKPPNAAPTKVSTVAPPAAPQSRVSAPLPLVDPEPQDEVWRAWRSPQDALQWAQDALPFLRKDELQRMFDEIPAQNGKKAPAWVGKVMEILESTNV